MKRIIAIEIDAEEKTCGRCTFLQDLLPGEWYCGKQEFSGGGRKRLCLDLQNEPRRLPECLEAEEYMKTFDKES